VVFALFRAFLNPDFGGYGSRFAFVVFRLRSFVTTPGCHVIRALEKEDKMYALISRYKRPLSEVDKHTEAHRAWLRQNYAAGTFLISGRQRSGTGGFILAAAMERGQLDSILADDPFRQNDLADYEIVEVGPTMADERLSFLIEK
jgi:uncharacterized protein YciI